MNVMIWLAIGGLVGWLVSAALRITAPEKVMMNVAIGSAGAALSGGLVTPYLGIAALTRGSISAGALFVSFLGAVAVLAIVNLVRRTAAGIRW